MVFTTAFDAPDGGHTKQGLFHCSFVKTLTNLTELGPDDGGTVVVAGSHKLDLPVEEMVACAYADPSLIHLVVAPAGSTLLFAETLVHATGRIRSERERAIIVCDGTRLFPYWGWRRAVAGICRANSAATADPVSRQGPLDPRAALPHAWASGGSAQIYPGRCLASPTGQEAQGARSKEAFALIRQRRRFG